MGAKAVLEVLGVEAPWPMVQVSAVPARGVHSASFKPFVCLGSTRCINIHKSAGERIQPISVD